MEEELIEKLFDKIAKQDSFILKIFSDERISDIVKNEYAEEYNNLMIQTK